jgi:hypothetical protein
VSARTEYGIICDRRRRGLGKVLLAISGQPNAALSKRADDLCNFPDPHAHLLVTRRVTYTEWSAPISGETHAPKAEDA